MNYQSTRNHRLQASSAAAVLEGIAADGGLYIRDDLSTMNFDWEGLLGEDSLTMSARILSALLPDIPDMETLVKQGYEGKFETDELMPLAQVGDRYVLELFRGPTSAFKDVALSLLPRLITSAKTVCGVDDEIVILTATSGDTGKAALEGFHDVPGTRIIVFYPHGGVSTVQQAQMATQEGDNVAVYAVNGNFDDAQTGVKRVFADEDLAQELAAKNKQLFTLLAKELVANAQPFGSDRLVFVWDDSLSADELKSFAAQLSQHSQVVGALFTRQGEVLSYALCRSADAGCDLRALCQTMNKALGGKGGGNQELCCGRLPVCEEAALRDCLLSFAK